MNVKEIIMNRIKSVRFWLTVLSFICAVVTLILYVTMGKNEFNTELSGKVIAFYCIIIAASVFLCVMEIRYGKFIVYLLGLVAWLEYFVTQINYIANVFTAIDGSTFSVAFIMTVIFGALVWLAALVSAILQKKNIIFKAQA